MALFNKLFSTQKNTTNNKQQDKIASEKLFAFSKDQVRIVLFRECDFRGRKLLFDSISIKKIPVKNETKEEQEKFAEISDGYGYTYAKPHQDTNQLGEMVFGSVAMSFRGTYFKIHNLANPARFMFSQVFPSPPTSNKYRRVSASSPYNSHPNTSSRSSQSFEHSNNKLDDSGASSMSFSERSSVNSTNSDTVLICRGHQSCIPLDEPLMKDVFSGDSGFCAAYSSFSSDSTQNFNASILSLNCGYKKWLRRHSTSLEKTGNSLPASFEEIVSKSSHSRSKLGLAIMIQPTLGQEEELGRFLMEHVAVMESIFWRARHLLEVAFIKSHQFLSLMMEVANFTTQYLVNLLSGSYLSKNLWLSLSSGCDNFNSISAFSNENNRTQGRNSNKTADLLRSSSSIEFSINPGKGLFLYESEHSFLNTLFKSEWDLFPTKRKPLCCENKSFKAEKFLYEFCELLEAIDVKRTNFFLSTLLTAVLTHHLGWVNTCLPSTNIEQNVPYNPLWGQLSDLYGAIGHPTKMAQTVITGTTQKDLITRIINVLTYFIRCCDVERNFIERAHVNEDNKIVEGICLQQSCIPKENYKKYEDHLREIMNSNCIFSNCKEENIELKLKKVPNNLGKKGLTKSKTKANLNDLLLVESKEEKKSGLTKTRSCLTELDTTNKGSKLSRVRNNTMLCQLGNDNDRRVIEGEEKNDEKDNDKNVIFVLGENEKLVGLKKETVNYLDFNDKDFTELENQSTVKPSTSWSDNDSYNNKNTLRSQSVPPEDRNSHEKQQTKTSKYRYSGVKFNLQQYPQILSNYMKSKNLELSNLQFGEKGGKIDEASNLEEIISTSYTKIENDFEESEALQTPSNASELEFTSDLFIQSPVIQQAKETEVELPTQPNFVKKQLSNTFIIDNGCKTDKQMKVAFLPMPKSISTKSMIESIEYTSSLMRPASDYYLPDMVLQGTTCPKQKWESKLKKDLALASQRSLIDQPVDEAVAIIANMDTWEVQLMSSHTYIVDKGSTGIRVGMSQLVANMLESLLQLWKLNVPPQYCLLHLEQMLQELCLRSKALAQLLLATEFCSMELLTNTLQLEVNDVPLLLAVASTHTPQVTQKYGLSFQ